MQLQQTDLHEGFQDMSDLISLGGNSVVADVLLVLLDKVSVLCLYLFAVLFLYLTVQASVSCPLTTQLLLGVRYEQVFQACLVSVHHSFSILEIVKFTI